MHSGALGPRAFRRSPTACIPALSDRVHSGALRPRAFRRGHPRLVPARARRRGGGVDAVPTDEFSASPRSLSQPDREETDERPPEHPHPLARPRDSVRGRPDDRRRHDGGERRAALDPQRPALLPDLPGLGRERLHAHLRRLPPARRPARRPLRPPPAVSERHRRVHRGEPGVRRLDVAGDADRCARRAGTRRRGRVRGRLLADRRAVHGAVGAREGDGRVRLRDGRRRKHRRADGRRAHRPGGLALDLPGQPADRRRRDPQRPQAPARGADGRRAAAARRRRRGGDHRRDGARCLRDRERQHRRLDVGADARPARGRRRSSSRRSLRGSRAWRSR